MKVNLINGDVLQSQLLAGIDRSIPYDPIYKSHRYNDSELDLVARTTAVVLYIISSWQANVGANDSEVIIEANISQKTKDKYKKKLYNIMYTQANWQAMQQQIIRRIAIDGSCVVMPNKDDVLTVYPIRYFEIDYDFLNRQAQYHFIVNGRKIASNLTHGVEMWHVKDPIAEDEYSPASRLVGAMDAILMAQGGVTLTTNQFYNGFLTNVFLDLDPTLLPSDANTKKPELGNKTWIDWVLTKVRDRFSGTRHAGGMAHIPALRGFHQIKMSNKEAEFYPIIKELTPERIAWAYSMTASNLGSGQHLTENNASTFDDSLYDKFGRRMEQSLDQLRNDFIFKHFGVETTEDLYIKFIPPEDPKKLLELEAWREDFKVGLIDINEYREKRGLPLLDEQKLAEKQQNNNQNKDKNNNDTKKEDQNNEKKNLKTKFSFADQTASTIDQALISPEFTKLKTKLTKALKAQLLDVITNLQNGSEKVPKLESYIDFGTFKKLIIAIADQYGDTEGEEQAKQVLDWADARVQALLKGGSDMDSLDSTLSAIIAGLLAELGEDKALVAEELDKKIDELVDQRADLIADTETTTVIGASYFLASQDKKYKTAIVIKDERLCPVCSDNGRQGQIPIGQEFASGHQYTPFHPRCRCYVKYSN